jgi:hypothetical protein
MKTSDKNPHRSLKERIVIIFGIFKTVLLFSFVALLVKLGYEGFRAGEMGFMVGIFLAVTTLIILPVLIFKMIVMLKLLQRKKWALIASIVFTSIFILINFISLTFGIFVFVILFIFIFLMLLLEIRVLKSDTYT